MVNKISTHQTPLTTPVKGMPTPEAGILGAGRPDKPASPQPATQLHVSESLSATAAAAQSGAVHDAFDTQQVSAPCGVGAGDGFTQDVGGHLVKIDLKAAAVDAVANLVDQLGVKSVVDRTGLRGCGSGTQ